MNFTLHLRFSGHTLLHIIVLGFAGFILSMLVTPLFTTLAYKYKWWKKPRKEAWAGGEATVYNNLHAAKHERHIPTMAGLIFIFSIAAVTIADNLTRSQTWLPLVAMCGAGAIGLIDDVMNIKNLNVVAGMKSRMKLLLYSVVAVIGGWWFYDKLGRHSIYLPIIHQWHIGAFIILVFWLVVIATANSVNITDGLDGLAGGLLASSFSAYAVIAFIQGSYSLAAFCVTIVGALLSYTWFNIFPARFFMGDSGAFALGTALGVIAMLTNTVYILPIIGLVYVIETGSVIINRLSRWLRHGKKVFLSSPIHHHFEAIGWPETKVTMRFWILGQASAFLGLIVFLVNRVH